MEHVHPYLDGFEPNGHETRWDGGKCPCCGSEEVYEEGDAYICTTCNAVIDEDGDILQKGVYIAHEET